MDTSALCWCGMSHRNNHHLRGAYLCVAFSKMDAMPGLARLFAKCGCDPERGEVGILLREDYEKLCRE